MSKTPLEKIQDEAAATLGHLASDQSELKSVLDAFLLQAYSAGVNAHREVMYAVMASDVENFRRKTARGRGDR